MTWLCQPFLKRFCWHFSCWIELDLKAGTGTREEVRNTSYVGGCCPTGTKANGFNTECRTKDMNTHMTDYTYICVSLLGYLYELFVVLVIFFPHVYLKDRADILLIFYRKKWVKQSITEQKLCPSTTNFYLSQPHPLNCIIPIYRCENWD